VPLEAGDAVEAASEDGAALAARGGGEARVPHSWAGSDCHSGRHPVGVGDLARDDSPQERSAADEALAQRFPAGSGMDYRAIEQGIERSGAHPVEGVRDPGKGRGLDPGERCDVNTLRCQCRWDVSDSISGGAELTGCDEGDHAGTDPQPTPLEVLPNRRPLALDSGKGGGGEAALRGEVSVSLR